VAEIDGIGKGALGGFAPSREKAAAKLPAAERFEMEAMPHFADLFRTARRVLGDSAKAEDVTQEAYLQAWKSFGRFEPGTNCRAWMYKILFHCVQHHWRQSAHVRPLKESEEFLEANLVYNEPVPEQITDEDILAALDHVPEDYRDVLLLVDVQEFAYKETAEILEVPIGTVMSRLSRARKALRDQLAEVARSYGLRANPQAI